MLHEHFEKKTQRHFFKEIFFRIFDFEFRKCPPVKMSLRPRFDPVQHGLESNFRLTRFSQLVGSACRAPADLNNKLCQVR